MNSPGDIVGAAYQAWIDGSSGLDFVAEDVVWNCAHPVNELIGLEQTRAGFWAPLHNAMPDIERRPLVVVNGTSEGAYWQTNTGHLVGTFHRPLFGIPATGQTLFLRFTEMVRFDQAKIKACFIILDFLDAMNQAGVNPLRASPGHSGTIPAPASMDGIQPRNSDPAQSEITRELVTEMAAELARFDGRSLASMDLAKHWHPDFMWYGPAGIGTTRGIDGFRKHHQGPFVFAFPDRSIDRSEAFIAEGNYAAVGGWPHMSGTHTGHSGWMGMPPTGKEISMRVFDIWRRDKNLLVENWVAIDIIDMLMQMGLDVFEQMQQA